MATNHRPTDLETTRNDIRLRDVRDGRLVVTYTHRREHPTITDTTHVSARLPFECLTLFEGGVCDPADLTDEERAWIEAEGEFEVRGVGA